MTDKKHKPTGQPTGKDAVTKAHEEAEKDIARDADLSIHSPNDDLDEEESARLGDEGKEDAVL